MTRSPAKADALAQAGGRAGGLRRLRRRRAAAAVSSVRPRPGDAPAHRPARRRLARSPTSATRNDRIRREGTRNLLSAAAAAGVPGARFLAQSIAWDLPGERGERNRAFERTVLDAGGVIIRYGQLYGPGTYYPDPDAPPPPPRVHVDEAAQGDGPAAERRARRGRGGRAGVAARARGGAAARPSGQPPRGPASAA